MSLKDTALTMGLQALDGNNYKGKINNIHQEIRLIKAIINEYKLKPFFRKLAVWIINNFPCQHKNYDCYIYAIAKWVRDNIKYIKDVSGYETLQTPDNTLHIGGGDCDDHAILLATLFESIGLKTTLKIVGENGKYKHIYVIVETPKGKKWAVDTTEKNFIVPEAQDENFEMQILEDLEGLEELGWGFHPFKAIKRAISKPKIKIKPKKFVKRVTGGIRHPKRFVKDVKKKPLAFLNKRFREIIPKPIKASRRAFSPIVKPIEHKLHKIEKLSPIKGLHIAKFVKRATGSHSIDEAGIKIAGAVLAAKAAAGAVGAKTAGAGAGASASGTGTYASMQSAIGASAAGAGAGTAAATAAGAGAGAGLLSSIGSTAGSIAAGVGTTLATNYIANKLAPQPENQIPLDAYYQQNPYINNAQNPFTNPIVIASGLLAIGLILRR